VARDCFIASQLIEPEDMMKRRKIVAIALLAVTGTVLQLSPTAFGQARAAGKWTTLFNGKSLKGWNPIGNANWRLGGGFVQADKGVGFLVSSASYADYQLRAEFWVDADANSGVFIRCEDPANVAATNAYEVNIFDKRPDQSYRTGAIVDIAKPLAQVDAAGKWNTMEITAQGPHFTVTLNGIRTADGTDSKHARGAIALQYGAGNNGAGVVRFRKVEIRTL
jgi:hypothetical protein